MTDLDREQLKRDCADALDALHRTQSVEYRAQGERSFAETTLVRLRFAATRPDWAGEELRALQASAQGVARSALHQRDWTLLAWVLPAVLLRGGVFGSLWAKVRRRVLGRPVDVQGEGSSM